MMKGVFRGHACVLKRFAVGDARTRGQMEKEIRVLQKLRHPLIVELQAVFYDEGDSYLQLPYAEHGTLREWMCDRLSCEQVQVVGRQVRVSLTVAAVDIGLVADLPGGVVCTRARSVPQVCFACGVWL